MSRLSLRKKSSTRRHPIRITRREIVVLVAIAATLGILVLLYSAFGHPSFTPGPRPVAQSLAATTSSFEIPVMAVADRTAHFFSHRVADRSVRFFVVRASDGVHAALDACEVCYRSKKGYEQHGQELVCRKCGKRTAILELGTTHDQCSPIGIASAMKHDRVVIHRAEVEKHVRYF